MGTSTSPSSLEMGLFDFFSAEAREKRELKRQKEIEEQERLQMAILERRSNPEKMEEYEAKIQQRRNLRMQGKDEEASNVELFDDLESQTLLDGTTGIEGK